MIRKEDRYTVRPDRNGGEVLNAFMTFVLCAFLLFAALPSEASTQISVSELLDEARADGAIIVECRAGNCYDVDTGNAYDFVGQDGFYIVYPIDKFDDEKKEKAVAAAKAAQNN